MRNFRLSLVAAIVSASFHITTVWLPISIAYPFMFLQWVTRGRVVWPLDGDWHWLIFALLAIVNVISFLFIIRLLKQWRLRTQLFLVSVYGFFPTLIISTCFLMLWNIVYIVVLWKTIKKVKHEFPPSRKLPKLIDHSHLTE